MRKDAVFHHPGCTLEEREYRRETRADTINGRSLMKYCRYRDSQYPTHRWRDTRQRTCADNARGIRGLRGA